MASEVVKNHEWHLVEPSPWPIVGTVAAFTMAMGGIWYMHDGPLWVFPRRRGDPRRHLRRLVAGRDQ